MGDGGPAVPPQYLHVRPWGLTFALPIHAFLRRLTDFLSFELLSGDGVAFQFQGGTRLAIIDFSMEHGLGLILLLLKVSAVQGKQ